MELQVGEGVEKVGEEEPEGEGGGPELVGGDRRWDGGQEESACGDRPQREGQACHDVGVDPCG